LVTPPVETLVQVVLHQPHMTEPFFLATISFDEYSTVEEAVASSQCSNLDRLAVVSEHILHSASEAISVFILSVAVRLR
jgi:hypothetical protein